VNAKAGLVILEKKWISFPCWQSKHYSLVAHTLTKTL